MIKIYMYHQGDTIINSANLVDIFDVGQHYAWRRILYFWILIYNVTSLVQCTALTLYQMTHFETGPN